MKIYFFVICFWEIFSFIFRFYKDIRFLCENYSIMFAISSLLLSQSDGLFVTLSYFTIIVSMAINKWTLIQRSRKHL